MIKIVRRGDDGGKRKMKKITKDTLISECLELNPDSAEILMAVGMHCIGCALAQGETIEQAVWVHGNDLERLLAKLNEGIEADGTN